MYSGDPRNISGTPDNLALGAVSTGIGYSTLPEMSAAINIPMMAENTYSHCHYKISDFIYSTSEKVLDDAEKEEAELDRNLGEIDGNGIPFITVVADGARSKRSYN
ncbi:hypothetical protein JTB14_016391 [Gonioctena quinquepunctata]|nr:hypothetical protein JTB14_016391 [Gonioctena quinquepunctata]